MTLFLVQLKLILSKPGLKKARKASQFSKRSSRELLYLQRTPFGVFFFMLPAMECLLLSSSNDISHMV